VQRRKSYAELRQNLKKVTAEKYTAPASEFFSSLFSHAETIGRYFAPLCRRPERSRWRSDEAVGAAPNGGKANLPVWPGRVIGKLRREDIYPKPIL
jgi:hypothetical protein